MPVEVPTGEILADLLRPGTPHVICVHVCSESQERVKADVEARTYFHCTSAADSNKVCYVPKIEETGEMKMYRVSPVVTRHQV
jgi:hypothetical protein